MPMRTLSASESRALTSLAAAGLRVFTVAEAQRLLAGNRAEANKLLHRLAAKHWLERLERGRYRLLPLEAGPEPLWAEHEFLLASKFVEPYYLAYGTALEYYNYSERRGDTVWLATTKRKRPTTVGTIRFRFVTLAEHKFFGYQEISLLGGRVSIAEREKAVVDGFDHPEYCGGGLEPAKALWLGSAELDWERLLDYAERLSNVAAQRRLGFWLERLNLGSEPLLERLRMPANRNYARLDPLRPAAGPRSARWRLLLNVPERELLEWQEH